MFASTIQKVLEPVVARAGADQHYRASDTDIADLEKRIGGSLVSELQAWLRIYNGGSMDGGVLLGARRNRRILDIGSHLELMSEWNGTRWLPVASDGFGNYYVLVGGRAADGEADRGGPVVFVDVHQDPIAAAYLVSSNFEVFLTTWLTIELAPRDWPLGEAEVLDTDPSAPAVAAEIGVPMPWEAP